MNEEFEDYTHDHYTLQPGTNLIRQLKKVVKPLNPGEEVQKVLAEPSTLIFRMKRNAEVEPLDIMAIDSLNVSQMSKKVQKNHIRDLENTMNSLTITENTQNTKESTTNTQGPNGLVDFSEGIDDLRLVLRRVNPSNIFELAQDEDTFRKNYKTVYNEMHSKLKREAKIDKIRKNLVSQSKNLKIFDIDLKNEFKQNVLYCNNQPMLVTDLTKDEKAPKKDAIELEDDGSYDYYFLQQVPKQEASQAEKIHLHDTTKNIVRSHFVEDGMQLVYEQQGVDSDDEVHQNPDNVDSNDENNPENDYPEEEDEGGYYNNNRRDSDDFESDYGDYDRENDDDDEDYDSRCDREYQEQKFSSNFFSKIKNMADDNFEWPGSKK